jgi:predicted RNA-binding protein with TRAM domain
VDAQDLGRSPRKKFPQRHDEYPILMNRTKYIQLVAHYTVKNMRGVKMVYKKNSRSSYGGGGYNQFERREPRNAPVEVGKQYDVKIEDIAKQGDGIARINGFVIFVPGTQINDELKIEIKAVKRNFAFGEVV